MRWKFTDVRDRRGRLLRGYSNPKGPEWACYLIWFFCSFEVFFLFAGWPACFWGSIFGPWFRFAWSCKVWGWVKVRRTCGRTSTFYGFSLRLSDAFLFLVYWNVGIIFLCKGWCCSDYFLWGCYQSGYWTASSGLEQSLASTFTSSEWGNQSDHRRKMKQNSYLYP